MKWASRGRPSPQTGPNRRGRRPRVGRGQATDAGERRARDREHGRGWAGAGRLDDGVELLGDDEVVDGVGRGEDVDARLVLLADDLGELAAREEVLDEHVLDDACAECGGGEWGRGRAEQTTFFGTLFQFERPSRGASLRCQVGCVRLELRGTVCDGEVGCVRLELRGTSVPFVCNFGVKCLEHRRDRIAGLHSVDMNINDSSVLWRQKICEM